MSSSLQLPLLSALALLQCRSSVFPHLFPLLLDTVPVEKTTIDAWKEPPFSGKFDGEFVWGRGSCDVRPLAFSSLFHPRETEVFLVLSLYLLQDKSGTIGILSAFESLLEAGFSPRRTVLFASGFDEEGSGPRGAGMIGPYLEKTYGRNGIAMIVDEGGGYAEQFGVGESFRSFRDVVSSSSFPAASRQQASWTLKSNLYA